MSDFVSNLKSLKEEHDRYEDAFLNAFYHVAQKDVILEKVVQYFDTKVVKRLTDVFCPNDQFSLLGVGVGEGTLSSYRIVFFYRIRYDVNKREDNFPLLCPKTIDAPL